MTKTEAIEYGIRWKDAIIDRGDTELSDAIQFLNMAIEALQQEPIIRCEDCKYAKPFLHRYHCKQLDEDWEINFGAEHYCSFAEQKESDEE